MDARTQKMVEMYRQGVTLQKIGDQFKLTRERVRQIIRPHINSSDGGRFYSASIKRDKREQERDARARLSHGVSYEELKLLRAERITLAYIEHKRNAKIRGVGWLLTFAEWLSIWKASGKLHLRGRGIGRYVMSRMSDDGPYAVGNVHIQLATENSREAVEKWRGKTKQNTGVFLLYPGRDRAWAAQVQRKRIGYFTSEAEAVAARNAYLEANPHKRPSRGRGYTVLSGGDRARRYQVMVGSKYVGSFYTAEEALAARAAYMSQVAVKESA